MLVLNFTHNISLKISSFVFYISSQPNLINHVILFEELKPEPLIMAICNDCCQLLAIFLL